MPTAEAIRGMIDHRAEVARAVVDAAPRFGFDRVPMGLVVAQSALETGAWTSRIFRENHNAFGMKLPTRRDTLATGERYGHATYNSVPDSVADYFMRQRAYGIPNTADPREYMAATIASGYATDPGYLDKWANVYGMGPDLSAALLGGLALLTVMLTKE